MANKDAPLGLIPIRHMSGAPYNGAVRSYYINATYATDLFVGDPVVKVGGGSNTTVVNFPGVGDKGIGTLPEIQKATAGDGNAITGVIVSFAADPDSLETAYSRASTEGVAYVCDDPDIIFEIQADGAVPAASMGLNANLIFTNSGDVFSGRSGVELETPPAANASNQLLIISAVDRPDNDTTLTNPVVEVIINNHTMASPALGI